MDNVDPRLEFFLSGSKLALVYLVPHMTQNLEEASPFGWYTPGLIASTRLLLSAAQCPADVREPFASPEIVLGFRQRRMLWRQVVPIELDALRRPELSERLPFFRVILTNEKGIASAVEKINFSDEIPYLHVSSEKGDSRLDIEDFSRDSLLKYVTSTIDHISNMEKWQNFSEIMKESMPASDLQAERQIELLSGHHNLTTPNEHALTSFGFSLSGSDPLVPRDGPGAIGDSQAYVDRICIAADAVHSAREKLMQDLPPDLLDNAYIISTPSIYWGHYDDWQRRRRRDQAETLTDEDKKAFDLAYRSAIQQSSYFHSIEVPDNSEIPANKYFQLLVRSRSEDQYCYTAALTLLSSNTLTPVIRLEPKLNTLRGQLKQLAHCARFSHGTHSQFKKSRLARNTGSAMRSLISADFLKRIDEAGRSDVIQGLKLVSDVPLEWLPSDGLPLGLRFDLSRIPVNPGNLLVSHSVSPPSIIHTDALFDILVIRAFTTGDPLRPMVEDAIENVLGGDLDSTLSVRFVDVENVEDFVEALENFSGALLIFDGHGSYDQEYGIGTFVIGGNDVDVWSLREFCSFPPIVIFSACDTHPLDGSHSSCANAAFVLGARTVLATSLPVDGRLAAIFLGRLILRLSQFVPLALANRTLLTWREVISGLLRMSYVSECTRLLVSNGRLTITQDSLDRVQLAANLAINARMGNWFDVYAETLAEESSTDLVHINELHSTWSSFTDAQKYIQLGGPENIVIINSTGADDSNT